MKKIYSILLAVTAFIFTADAQLFQQQFDVPLAAFGNSSSTDPNYVNTTAPSNSQFTQLQSTSNSAQISVPSTGPNANKLYIVRSSGNGIFARNGAAGSFGNPGVLVVKFDLNVINFGSTSNTGITFQVGSGFSNTVTAAEATANVHSFFAVRMDNTTTKAYRLRSALGTNGATAFTGTTAVTFVINNSGSTYSYVGPDGNNYNLSNDTYDLWGNTSREFTAQAATTAAQTLDNFKMVLVQGEVTFDNIMITNPAAVPPTAPTTQASLINFASVTPTTFNVNWTRGNGSNVAVFMKEGTGAITNPTDGSAYTASANWNSKGDQLGTSGYYAVYNGTGTTVSVTNLLPSTTYTVQAFEFNGSGSSTLYNITTATDNPNSQATAALSAPVVSTTAVTNITYNAATSGGNVTSDGGAAVTERGVVYSTTTNPTTVTGTKVVDGSGGTGAYVSNLTGLSPTTTYYVRAYAINSQGTDYGSEISFSTPAAPQLYRSVQNGNWNDPATWESNDGSGWVASTTTPTSTDGTIIIRDGDTVTVTANITADEVTVNSTGVLIVNSGVTFTVSNDGTPGADLLVDGTFQLSGTFASNASSTILVNGTFENLNTSAVFSAGSGTMTIAAGGTFKSSGHAGNTVLSFTNVTFTPGMGVNGATLYVAGVGAPRIPATNPGNVVWNAASNTFLNSATTTIGGNLTVLSGVINNGSGGTGRALTISGDLIVAGGEYHVQGASGGSAQVTTVNGNVVVTGGKLFASSGGSSGTLNIKGNLLQTGGEIGVTGTSPVGQFVFNGTSTQSATFATHTGLTITLNNSQGLTLGSDVTVAGVFTLTAGQLSVNGNTLTIGSTIARTGGSINASTGTVAFAGTANQIIPANTFTGNVNNLTVNNTGAASTNVVSLNSATTIDGVLSVTTGVLNVASGTLTLGASASGIIGSMGDFRVASGAVADLGGRPVTVQSSDAGTGRIGVIADGASGLTNATAVTIERFIPAAGNRAWRLLAAPVKAATAPTIFSSWQEGGAATVTGTHITQAGGAGSGGFDASSAALNRSIHYYDGTALQGPANTDNTKVTDNGAAWFLFVRGNRQIALNDPSQSSNTTLRITGAPHVGPVTTGVPGASFSLIPNPYPSAVDFEAIRLANPSVGEAFYIWDSKLGTVGAYRTVDRTDPGVYEVTPADGTTPPDNSVRIIRSGQAFFVGTSTTVDFTESMKTEQLPSINVFRTTTGTEEMLVNLNIVNASIILADGVRAKYNNNYSASVTTEDINKLANFNENIAIARGNKLLSVEKRPLITANDTIFLKQSNMGLRSYQFQLSPVNFEVGALTARLEDLYLNTATTVDLSAVTTYDFSVTTDAASANPDRFRIVFASAGTLPVNFTNVKAYQQNNGIQVEWNVAAESNIRTYEVEKSVDGRTFTPATSVTAKANNNGAVSYAWFDANAVNGNNFYRIKANDKAGTAKLSAVVNVRLGKSANITVYPNPVKNNVVSLQFENQPKGLYTARVFNNLGQVVFTKTIQHTGGSSTQTIALDGGLTKGVYQMQVTNGEENFMLQIICN